MEIRYNVYALRHTDGRYYFGQTKSSVHDRWLAHVAAARHGRSSRINEVLRADGPDAFEVLPMLQGLTKDAADEWERTMVERFESRGVLNDVFTQIARKRSAKIRKNVPVPKDVRDKMSAAHKARWAAMSSDDRARLIQARVEAGAAARRGKRRLRCADGTIKFVDWASEEDRLEAQRQTWRVKARRARDRKARLKSAKEKA